MMTELEALAMLRERLSNAKLNPKERAFLSSLSLLIAQQSAELETLKRLGNASATSLDLNALLNSIAAEAMRLVRYARYVHIYLFENQQLTCGTALGSNGERAPLWGLPRPNGLNYEVVHTRSPLMVTDMRNSPFYKGMPDIWEGSVLGLPLLCNDQLVGVMNLWRAQTGEFSNSEVRLLTLLASQASSFIYKANMHSSANRQAHTDALTGLPNRRALDEKLEEEVNRATRYAHQFCVVMMDLDGFKRVNDCCGHETGDIVLKAAFNTIAGQVRASDFLARYGGDELTLILPESDTDTALAVCLKLQNALRKLPLTLPSGEAHMLDLSGGIAQFPMHGQSASDLLRAADAALYRAKKGGRGIFVLARGPTAQLIPTVHESTTDQEGT